ASAGYSIEIRRAPGFALEIATSTLPVASVGAAYSFSFIAHGGTPPYAWSVGGDLPSGLTLSDQGRLEGTPTVVTPVAGHAFDVTVTDAEAVAVTKSFVLRVDPAPLACADVSNVAPLPVGVAIEPIELAAGGGLPPYAWTSGSGAVPGLALSTDGVIAGTPSDTGRWSWAVEVSDARSVRSTCRIRIEVSDGLLRISSTELPRARVEEAYEVRLESTGASGAVTWSLGSEGELPEGLELTDDGLVRGVPEAAQLGREASRTFSFEVVAKDVGGNEAGAVLSLEIFDERSPSSSAPKKKGGGCQSASADASLLALGLALCLAGLGRRRSGS
ncbi:MAG TPA: Ig domain-containing protein, partial [Vulgatibacter sp.]